MGVGLGEGVEGGLGDGVGAPVGVVGVGGAGRDENGAAGVCVAQERVEGADEAPVGGDVGCHHRCPGIIGDVGQGGDGAEQAGVGDDYPPTWFGLFAPAGTPRAIVAKIATEVARITEGREFLQRVYIDRGIEPAGVRLDDFARFIAQERSTAARMAKEAGLQPE